MALGSENCTLEQLAEHLMHFYICKPRPTSRAFSVQQLLQSGLGFSLLVADEFNNCANPFPIIFPHQLSLIQDSVGEVKTDFGHDPPFRNVQLLGS